MFCVYEYEKVERDQFWMDEVFASPHEVNYKFAKSNGCRSM